MNVLPGVYQAVKKDGTIYYRSNITYRNKHISLGSYPTEMEAHRAYCDAGSILDPKLGITLELLREWFMGWYQGNLKDNAFLPEQGIRIALDRPSLNFEKSIILLNFRDHNLYIANPIYLRKNYFSYFLSPTEELKFDIDDLFYYSSHKIMRRQGHLFVCDYGMQVTIFSRYGLKSHAVCHRDYEFANGDPMDWRYSNIVLINQYHGVTRFERNGKVYYRVKIHIKGNFTIGTYSTQEKAAVAYNKAAAMARAAGINRKYTENYLASLTPEEYSRIYEEVEISEKYRAYLTSVSLANI